MTAANDTSAPAPALIEHATAERRARLSAMMRAHGDDVYAYTVRVLRNATLASDILQQVFEQAYRDIASLRDETQARSWLFGIAHHRCLDALKMRARAAKHLSDEPHGVESIPSAQAEAWERVAEAQMSAALELCIGELSDQTRTAVLLRFREGMTYEHMATVCGEKPATLQARVTRAMPALRRCLEAKGFEP